MKALHDAVRFGLELAALVALGSAGWQLVSGSSPLVRWSVAVAAPLAAAAAWGRFVAPRSAHRLDDPARLAVEIALFALAVAGLAATRRPGLAIALAIVAAVNVPLDRVVSDA